MPAVECNYHENKHAADRLYSNDEWISTGHAAGLRSKHREECTGETAQRRHGKDGLQQTVNIAKECHDHISMSFNERNDLLESACLISHK